jgi:flagellar protein FliS
MMEEPMHTGIAQYQNIQISTSNRENILLMLYDGAVNFTSIAIDRIRNGDIAGKGLYIGKAQAIVAELMNTLDHEVGGELTARLEQLYIYLVDEYIAANINNSAQSLENVLGILTSLRAAWVQAVESQKIGRCSDPRRPTVFQG